MAGEELAGPSVARILVLGVRMVVDIGLFYKTIPARRQSKNRLHRAGPFEDGFSEVKTGLPVYQFF
jgi:hypothetical protein